MTNKVMLALLKTYFNYSRKALYKCSIALLAFLFVASNASAKVTLEKNKGLTKYHNDLSDLYSAYRFSPNLMVEKGKATKSFGNDTTRIKRFANKAEFLDFKISGQLRSLSFTSFYGKINSPKDIPYRVFVSKTGQEKSEWLELRPKIEVKASAKSWLKASYQINEIPAGYDFFRIQFPVTKKKVWQPLLGDLVALYDDSVDLSYDNEIPPVIPSETLQDNFSNNYLIFSKSPELKLDSSRQQLKLTDSGVDKSKIPYVSYEVYGRVKEIEIDFSSPQKIEHQVIVLALSTTGDLDNDWSVLTDYEVIDKGQYSSITAIVPPDLTNYDFVKISLSPEAHDIALEQVEIRYLEDFELYDDNISREIDYQSIGGGQARLAVPAAIKQLMADAGIQSKLDWYVTRGQGKQSNRLFAGGDEPFRFVSYNIPNLNMSEDPFWSIKPDFEIEDGIRTIAHMGAKVTRVYTLSIEKIKLPKKKENKGNQQLTLPKKNENELSTTHISWDENRQLVFNEDAFVAMDKMLAYSNKHGVRVIIPFIDRNDWWGGIKHFSAAYQKSYYQFYTDEEVISEFKKVIHYVLNRVNTITGVRYKDDPAVFAWETGNELRGKEVSAWTSQIAAYIKSIDSKHLVMDGKEASKPADRDKRQRHVRIDNSAIFDPNIDIISNHYYGGDYEKRLMTDLKTLADAKPFIIGETGLSKSTNIEQLVNAVIETNVVGVALWSLRTQDEQGGYRDHKDGKYHAYHWPGFAENEARYQEQTVMNFIWKKAYEINGLAKPKHLPAPEFAPVMLETSTFKNIRWRGVTSAQYYRIARSDNGRDDWKVIADRVTTGSTQREKYVQTQRQDSWGIIHDNVLQPWLFTDQSVDPGKAYYYRVQAVNSGGESYWSAPLKVSQ